MATAIGFRRDYLGFEAALSHYGLTLRLNVRNYKYEIRGVMLADLLPEVAWSPGPSGWGEFSDQVASRLRDLMARELLDEDGRRLALRNREWRHCVLALGQVRMVDPFLLWLEGLPAWDRVGRLDGILSGCLGAVDDEVSRTAGRLLLCAAVYRTLYPGAEIGWTPALIGEGGIGKSAFCRELFPVECGSWYCECVSARGSVRRVVESIGEAVVVEFSGIQKSKGDLERRILGNNVDRWGRGRTGHQQCWPKRWMGVGSGHPSAAWPVPGYTGENKRFVGINCRGAGSNSAECLSLLEGYLNEKREQLWAEAVYLTRQPGFSPRWPAGLHGGRGLSR